MEVAACPLSLVIIGHSEEMENLFSTTKTVAAAILKNTLYVEPPEFLVHKFQFKYELTLTVICSMELKWNGKITKI